MDPVSSGISTALLEYGIVGVFMLLMVGVIIGLWRWGIAKDLRIEEINEKRIVSLEKNTAASLEGVQILRSFSEVLTKQIKEFDDLKDAVTELRLSGR